MPFLLEAAIFAAATVIIAVSSAMNYLQVRESLGLVLFQDIAAAIVG